MSTSKFETVQLQDRDFTLLRGLFESRIMTVEHISTLYFEGKKEAAKKRLQKLTSAGLVGQRTRRAFEPAILFLTRKAFSLLKERGVLAEYPRLNSSSLDKRARVSELTLKHELEVMDVKTAFHYRLRETDKFTIAEFSTWPHLYEFKAIRSRHSGTEVKVKPDGFIRIHEKVQGGGAWERTFFLELDRSTETQDTLVTRAGCYLDYYKSGGFAVKNGASLTDLKDYPFRVLMIFKTPERRNNIAERLLQNIPPILRQVCLSTIDEVIADPFGDVWLRPVDYRNAVKGTSFDVTERRDHWVYQRQTAREVFVEQNVKKTQILIDPPTDRCINDPPNSPQ